MAKENKLTEDRKKTVKTMPGRNGGTLLATHPDKSKITGRPKGSRNRAAVVREWLEVETEIKNPITGKMEKLEVQDALVLAMIVKAKSGDVRAYETLMDALHGKMTEKVEQTITQLPTIPTKQTAKLTGKGKANSDVKPITNEAQLGGE